MTTTEPRISELSAERIHPTIGAVISGVDGKQPLDEHTVAFLREAIFEHKVIFLRDQHLDVEQQNRFSSYFGDEWLHPVADDYPDFEWLARQGTTRLRADNWHADATFVEEPPAGSILQLTEVPPVGGDTLFADLEAAYQGLSEPVRQLIDGLVALHDGENFQDWAWGPNVDDERRAQILEVTARKVEHPLAHVIPETGRTSLYSVTGFTRKIKGLTDDESRALLSLLQVHVNRPEYVVRFKWNAGDIAFWDNRTVLHRAANDYGDAPRKLQRTTITEFRSN
jgi:taurine dioxygenase